MSKNHSWKISLFNLLFIVLAVSLVFVSRAEARSGCCSHHGGVCTYKCSDGVNVGYYCCDGTSLSSTCAPYYPSCPLSLPTSTPTPSVPTQTSTPPQEPTPPKTDYTILATTNAEVIKVIDGDTIEKVRLIGIDTPETVDPRKPVECFGKESANKMKELVENKTVRLERKSEDNRDTYDRLLRYVYVDDLFVNAEMIKQGYAYAYTKYPFDAQLMEEFKQYEKEARKNEVGLWSPEACAGVASPVTSTTETPKDIQETPTTPTAETQENNSSVLVWVISGIVIAGGIGWRYLSKKKASNVH